MNKKYLFFDMDRTLIAPSTHHLLPSSIKAIKQAMHNGCHVFLCTGRSYGMALEYQEELHVPGVIFSNGAGICYEGKILESHDIYPHIVKQMTDLITALAGGFQLLGTEQTWQNATEPSRFAKTLPAEY